MKKFLLLSAVACAMLTACQNDVESAQAESEMKSDVKRVTMSVKDFEWEGQTRTTAEQTSTGVSFSWSEGDEIGVFPNAGDQVRFPIEEGAGTANATFNGGGWALKAGYTYVAYYPFSTDNYTNGRTAIPMTYAGQTQNGNASLANLGDRDYIVSSMTAPEGGEVDFQFSHLGALVRFVLTMPKAGTYSTLTLTTESNVIPVERNLDLSGATPDVTNKTMTNTISLSLTNITTSADNQAITLYMLMPECDLLGKTITVTIGDYTTDLAGKNMKGGKAYSYSAVMEKGGPYAYGHEYVDLGLPSGTLWATCNVGATNPEDYGLYFAWGETTGYTSDTSDGRQFDWANYKWCSNGLWTGMTKYCTSSSFGTVDNKTELDLEDDAAHVNWGGNWRMPSYTQQRELINSSYTTTTWTTKNGVYGRLITSKSNGNTLFLPAAGYRYRSGFNYGGTDGNYWSSSLNASRSDYAWNLYFLWNDIGVDDYRFDRCYGLSVRPVCSASE